VPSADRPDPCTETAGSVRSHPCHCVPLSVYDGAITVLAAAHQSGIFDIDTPAIMCSLNLVREGEPGVPLGWPTGNPLPSLAIVSKTQSCLRGALLTLITADDSEALEVKPHLHVKSRHGDYTPSRARASLSTASRVAPILLHEPLKLVLRAFRQDAPR